MTTTDNTIQTTAHTQEPWRIHRLNNGWPVITERLPMTSPTCSLNGKGLSHVEANARRLCAAVNACQGLSTEALELGVIAELRHVLGELLTAAGDLDAAIDSAVDQFDAERAKLTIALRHAQAILDGGTELGLHELLAFRGQIALGWSIEDVQEVRPGLTAKQAWEVLQDVERKHDATIGITWDTLEWVAENLFGPAPETAEEE